MGQPNHASKRAQETLANFVNDMKKNGFVRDSLLRHQIEGATIAP
jgi:hypothetical protein